MKKHQKNIKASDYPIGSKIWKYARMLEERRGHNYEYWNENHDELLTKGYNLYEFDFNGHTSTQCEAEAKNIVYRLRLINNCYARIVCGYNKNQQKIRMFSIIYKKKNGKAK